MLPENLKPAPAIKSAPPVLSSEIAHQEFFIKTASVKGSSAISPAELNFIFSPLMDRQVTFQQIIDVLSKIQQRLFDDGYSFSRVGIDDEALKKGDLVFVIQEPMVESVEVLPGVRDSFLLRSFVENIEGKTLNTKYLERLMLLMNERQGSSVVAVIASAQSPQNPTNLKIVIKNADVAEERVRSFVSIDNYGSNFTGPWIAQAGISVGSLGYHLGTLNLNTSFAIPANEMKRFGISYNTPLFGLSGWAFDLNGDYALTEPGDRLDELDIKGKSYSFGTDLTYAIIRQRDKIWSVSAGFDYKNSNIDITTDRLYDDRLRIVSIDTDYSFFDETNAINSASLSFSKGLDILGSSKSGSQDLSREDGRSDFSKMNLRASRLQFLPHELEFLTSFEGQMTNTPLLSSEEFGFGGGAVGRGYDPSEITGDKGYAVSVEVRKSYKFPDGYGRFQPYAFYDFGQVWNIDPDDKNKVSAASTGLGLRYFAEDNWNLNITIALPLTKDVDNPPAYANDSSPRFLLRFNKNF